MVLKPVFDNLSSVGSTTFLSLLQTNLQTETESWQAFFHGIGWGRNYLMRHFINEFFSRFRSILLPGHFVRGHFVMEAFWLGRGILTWGAFWYRGFFTRGNFWFLRSNWNSNNAKKYINRKIPYTKNVLEWLYKTD